MKNFGISTFDDSLAQKFESVNSKTIQRQTYEFDQQLDEFHKRLVKFARVHHEEIRANPEFRSKFIRLCSSIGIDSLTLLDKDTHFFNENDIYFELCVKIIEICRKTKDINGGIISLSELQDNFLRDSNVSDEDLLRSIEMLKVMDGGFDTFKIKNKLFLRSLPNELTSDQTKILEVCSVLGHASISLLKANLNWSNIRSKSILEEMVTNGLLWVDTQAGGKEILYWDPSWINKS